MGRPAIHPVKFCPDCGKRIRYVSQRCSPCAKTHRRGTSETRHDTCVDCGKPTGDSAHRAIRCWDCWLIVRRSKPVRLCSIDECSKKHRARGLCADHYAGSRMQRDTNTHESLPWNPRVRLAVAALPCQICGYNRLRSHIHRLLRADGYMWGNVVAVCARCHDEIHRGITAAPPALTSEKVYEQPGSSPGSSG